MVARILSMRIIFAAVLFYSRNNKSYYHTMGSFIVTEYINYVKRMVVMARAVYVSIGMFVCAITTITMWSIAMSV